LPTRNEKEQDAFGQELLDYYTGKNGFEIVERDDGFLDVSTTIESYFTEYRRWPQHQKMAIRLAVGPVLDVGCGAGRHSLHLQRKGVRVTGIDSSPLAIRVCRARGLKDARVLPATRIPSDLGHFDTILMLGNNFGLFGNFKRARWLLRRFASLTTAGAKIIAETLDPGATTDRVHLEYQKRNRKLDRMPGQVRLRVRYRRCASPWFDYLFVSKRDMERVLAGTGWKVERYFDSSGPVYVAIIVKE
jgi:SAM-dependent methyltransferase